MDDVEPEAPARALRLLVTDDNPINQRLLNAMLRGSGHIVTSAMNGREAVEAVRRADFDAILMDVQMPVMDGIQATRLIRAMPAPKCDVPIIALTADALRGAAERYRDAGMDGYVSKPLSPPALFHLLYELTRDGRPTRSPVLGLPSLDYATIEALRGFLNPAQLDGLLADTIAEIDMRVDRLRERLDAADAAGSAREAHDLVSIAGNCGASALSALARDIERSCRQGALEAAVRDFASFEAIAASALDELHLTRGTLAAAD